MKLDKNGKKNRFSVRPLAQLWVFLGTLRAFLWLSGFQRPQGAFLSWSQLRGDTTKSPVKCLTCTLFSPFPLTCYSLCHTAVNGSLFVAKKRLVVVLGAKESAWFFSLIKFNQRLYGSKKKCVKALLKPFCRHWVSQTIFCNTLWTPLPQKSMLGGWPFPSFQHWPWGEGGKSKYSPLETRVQTNYAKDCICKNEGEMGLK